MAASAISHPFRYAGDEWTDLSSLAVQQYADLQLRMCSQAHGFVRGNPD